jgi:hypothetical protein
MELKRKYLNTSEIATITEDMILAETEYERQLIKYGYIGKLLIGVENLGLTDDDTLNLVYETMLEKGIDVDKEVVNIDIIDKIVDKELGVAKTVEGILNGVIANIDESMKNIDLKKTMVELQNLQNKEA